jgi:modulator of FtsH protease
VLFKSLAPPGGAQVATLALAATGVTFMASSAWVLRTRRDFGAIGGCLSAGMVIALIAGLDVAAMAELLSAGLILFETSRVITGGETSYALATVGLYDSTFKRFTSQLSLFGFGSSDEWTLTRKTS